MRTAAATAADGDRGGVLARLGGLDEGGDKVLAHLECFF